MSVSARCGRSRPQWCNYASHTMIFYAYGRVQNCSFFSTNGSSARIAALYWNIWIQSLCAKFFSPDCTTRIRGEPQVTPNGPNILTFPGPRNLYFHQTNKHEITLWNRWTILCHLMWRRIHSFIHSFIHSLIHSFIHSARQCFHCHVSHLGDRVVSRMQKAISSVRSVNH